MVLLHTTAKVRFTIPAQGRIAYAFTHSNTIAGKGPVFPGLSFSRSVWHNT